MLKKLKCFLTGSESICNKDNIKNLGEVPLSSEGINKVDSFNYSPPNDHNQIIGNPDTLGIIKTKRTWGCELECGSSSFRNKVIGRMLIGANHNWGSDNSVSYNHSSEIKTCPLVGIDGETELREVCELIKNTKQQVNASCGTHCHIGVPEARVKNTPDSVEKKLKNLLFMYLVIDDAVVSMLPDDRRGNSYCQSFSSSMPALFNRGKKKQSETLRKQKRFDMVWFSSTKEVAEERKLRNSTPHGRYGINFGSLYKHGTLEIRYHEGTLDAERLIHWIAFHSAIVDMVMDGDINDKQINELAKFKETEKLLQAIIDMLGSKISTETISAIKKRYTGYKKLNKKLDKEILNRSDDDREDDAEDDDDDDNYWN